MHFKVQNFDIAVAAAGQLLILLYLLYHALGPLLAAVHAGNFKCKFCQSRPL